MALRFREAPNLITTAPTDRDATQKERYRDHGGAKYCEGGIRKACPGGSTTLLRWHLMTLASIHGSTTYVRAPNPHYDARTHTSIPHQ